MNIKPGAESIGKFSIKVNNIKDLNISNRADICASVSGRPKLEKIPLVFLSPNRWLISKVFKKEEIMALSSMETNPNSTGLDKNWTVIDFFDNELKLEERFCDKPGIIYLRHYVYSPDGRDIRVGLPSNCPFCMWLNGRVIHKVQTEGILRPNYAGDGRSYIDTKLKKGWNQFFIKIIRKDKIVQAHFVISGSAPFYYGFSDLIECKFPWEV